MPGLVLSSHDKDPGFAKALAAHLRDYDPPIFLDQGAIEQGVLQIAAICLREEDVATIGEAIQSFVAQ